MTNNELSDFVQAIQVIKKGIPCAVDNDKIKKYYASYEKLEEGYKKSRKKVYKAFEVYVNINIKNQEDDDLLLYLPNCIRNDRVVVALFLNANEKLLKYVTPYLKTNIANAL